MFIAAQNTTVLSRKHGNQLWLMAGKSSVPQAVFLLFAHVSALIKYWIHPVMSGSCTGGLPSQHPMIDPDDVQSDISDDK